ncbi:flavorubredoxin [Bradyrhizobium sp. RT9b]|uniref:ribbon-helix-helix domain-containing protein n=1 Tax=Bradyrhizobium sp. RT9b TaxID=3156385 RepID=UPI003391A4A3
MGEDGKNAARVTTTLRKKQKAQLEAIAEKQGVALSWLIRHLIERYLEHSAEERAPLVGSDHQRS